MVAERTTQSDARRNVFRATLARFAGDGPLMQRSRADRGMEGGEPLSNWWTPLLSSGGSGKVSNEPGTASFYG